MMPQSMGIVVKDMVNTGHVIKVYKIRGGKLRVDKTNKAPCEHYNTKLLGLLINNKELLAVSCTACFKIYILNLETEQVVEAFKGEWVEYMCHGRKGRMFVESSGDTVMELDCSLSRFTSKNTIHIGLEYCWSLCYLSTHNCLVVSNRVEIRAVSCWDSSLVWRVQGEVEGKKINPCALLLFRDSVLVADRDNERIIVVDPSDGSYIKTIQTPGVGTIRRLGLYNTQIVMLNGNVHKPKLSFFDIK